MTERTQPPGAGPAPMVRPESDDIAEQIAEASRHLELRDPDEALPFAERLVNRLVEVVGVSVLVAIVLVIFVNAVLRYAFDYSFIWAEEMVQMSLPWLAMTGVFLSVRRGTMIRIDFFYERIPERLRGVVASFGYSLCIVVLLFMGWISLDFVRQFGGDVALYVEIPTGWSTSALVFGSLGAAMAFAAEFCREWRGRRRRSRRGGSRP